MPYFEGWIRNRRRHLRSGVRLLQPQLAGGARDSRRARQHRSSRADPIAASRRTSCRGGRAGSSASACRAISASRSLTWTITANGKTEKAYGELLPVEEITERIIMTRGNLNPGDDDPNKPPAIAIAPVTAASRRRAGHAHRDGDRRWAAEAAAVPVASGDHGDRRDADSGAGQLVGGRAAARADGDVDAAARAGADRVRTGGRDLRWRTGRHRSPRVSARAAPTWCARPPTTARCRPKPI